MTGTPKRVTKPFLDVLEAFMDAATREEELHGWAIRKATQRSGPVVYQILERLESIGWVVGRWERENPQKGKPRRRLYRLTKKGKQSAERLLQERRPQQ